VYARDPGLTRNLVSEMMILSAGPARFFCFFFLTFIEPQGASHGGLPDVVRHILGCH